MSDKFPKTLFLLMAVSLLAILLTRTTSRATTQANGTTLPKTAVITTSPDNLYLPLITRPITSLAAQISVTTINLPVPLAGRAGSWCTWGGCTIGPRLWAAPAAPADYAPGLEGVGRRRLSLPGCGQPG